MQGDFNNMQGIKDVLDWKEIEAVKTAIKSVGRGKAGEKEILAKSIRWLWIFYQMEPKQEYLAAAYVHMTAYQEMGFPYGEYQELFDTILGVMGQDKWDLLSAGMYKAEKVPLKKCNVKAILGRWNPNLHSHRINDAVNDIIGNVSETREGTYLYHCGKKVNSDTDEKMWDKTFWLYVTEQGNLLYDSNEKQYYTFIQQEEKI